MRKLLATLRGPTALSGRIDRVLAHQAAGMLAVSLAHLIVITVTGAPARRDVILASMAVWVIVLVWVALRGPQVCDAEAATLSCTGAVALTVNGIWVQPPLHVALIATALLGVLLTACAFASPRVVLVLMPVVLTGQVVLQLATFGTGASSVFVACTQVMGSLAVCSLVSAGRRALDRAVEAATRSAATDPLTGLLNRRALTQRFAAMRSAAPEGQRVALVALDLDHFKAINDEHGHDAGDQVLQGVADTLRAHTRAGDLLVRLGGEELAWVGCWSSAEQTLLAAERLCAAVAATRPGGLPVTTSIGVAFSSDQTHAAGGAEALSRLLVRADAALYQAKRTGRNRVVLAPAPLPEDSDPHRGPSPLPRAPGSGAGHASEARRTSPTAAGR